MKFSSFTLFLAFLGVQSAKFVARFENLSEGSAPGSNYASVSWQNFAVLNSPSASAALIPASGLHVVDVFSELGTISQSGSHGSTNFQIKSLYFGCSGYIQDKNYQAAIPCTMTIVQTTYTNGVARTSQSFKFVPDNSTVRGSSHMTKATVTLQPSLYYLIFLSAARDSRAILYLDDVTIEQP